MNRVLENRLLSRLVNTGNVDRAERYFLTHGGRTVLIGRVVPGMRGLTPLFAGVSLMSLRYEAQEKANRRSKKGRGRDEGPQRPPNRRRARRSES